MKLTNQRSIPNTFAAMNVQATTAPASSVTGKAGRTHATVTRVKGSGWSGTDYALIAALIVAMFVLESRA